MAWSRKELGLNGSPCFLPQPMLPSGHRGHPLYKASSSLPPKRYKGWWWIYVGWAGLEPRSQSIWGLGSGRVAGLPEPPDVSLCTRSVHQVAAASVSMTTGSNIPTAAVQCMGWSPGEPRNQKSRTTGPACPPSTRQTLFSSLL